MTGYEAFIQLVPFAMFGISVVTVGTVWTVDAIKEMVRS